MPFGNPMKPFPKLKTPLVLAPMADVTHVAFRLLCRDLGASYAVTEMVSSTQLAQKPEIAARLLDTVPEEKPVGIQLFGEVKAHFLAAAELALPKADVIDINVGCPSPKLTNCDAGAALLKCPEKLQAIVAELSQLPIPITCKIRSGYSNDSIVAVKIARMIEEAGAAAITVHPRTKEQGYSGKADWDIIKQVKEAVNIPVIGNGDVRTPQDVKRMLDTTGCDYVMLARAALCNPFIFQQANYYLETGEVMPQAGFEEKLRLLGKYISLLQKYGIGGFNDIRQAAIYFSKGYHNSTRIRDALCKAKTIEEMWQALEWYCRNEDAPLATVTAQLGQAITF